VKPPSGRCLAAPLDQNNLPRARFIHARFTNPARNLNETLQKYFEEKLVFAEKND